MQYILKRVLLFYKVADMTSAISCTKTDIARWLEPVLEELGLEDYTVKLQGTSEKSDGYLGDINFVTASGKLSTGTNQTYSFAIKCGKKSTKLREKLPIRAAFVNEIAVYTKIFPFLQQFQAARNISAPFNHFPKCYQTRLFDDMEVIILKNMKDSNFVLWDRTTPMNQEHIREILKIYGKFHAISFALRDQQPKVFGELVSNIKDVFKLFQSAAEKEKSNSFQDIVAIAKEYNEFEILEKAMELQQQEHSHNLYDFLYCEESYTTITHGDCWNNNFMFQYENNDVKKLADVCLLDWQISRVSSPVLDLSHFLFCCICPEDLQYFDEFVNVYYDSFSKFASELGSEADKIFPFEQLMKHWSKYAKYGVIWMVTMVKMCLSETIDLTYTVESGKELSECLTNALKDFKEYKRRTFPILKFAIKRGFI